MAQVIEYNPYTETPSLRSAVAEELARQKAHTVWFNPETLNYHLSLTNSPIPDYSGPVITNRQTIQQMKNLKGAGSLSEDQARFNIYAKEFQDDAVYLHDMVQEVNAGRVGKLQAGAIISAQHFRSTAIVNQILSNEVIDFTFRDYQLMGAVSKETTQFIEVALPDELTTVGGITMGLNEFDTPDSLSVDYSQATTRLKKSGVNVEISIWFDLVSRRRDVIADINKYIPIDWEKKYNEEIATQLFTPMANVPLEQHLML